MLERDEFCPLGRFIHNCAAAFVCALCLHGAVWRWLPYEWNGWPAILVALAGALLLAREMRFRFRLRKASDWYYNVVSAVPAGMFFIVFLYACWR